MNMPDGWVLEDGGKVSGVRAHDLESGEMFDIRAKATINATGVFTEEVLALEKAVAPGSLLAVSQGSHVVLPREFLPSNDARSILLTAVNVGPIKWQPPPTTRCLTCQQTDVADFPVFP